MAYEDDPVQSLHMPFYCHFSEFSHILLSAGHDVPEEV